MSEVKEKKLVDFICKQANLSGFSAEIISKLNLKFPQSYCEPQIMAAIAKEVMGEDQGSICVLPFCHTVEAEALGGIINLNDGDFGPRAKDYACQTVEELLALPDINFTQGRIQAVLQAGNLLHQEGYKVALEVSGFFTLLNSLIDVSKVFKVWRKNPELIEQVMDKLSQNLFAFFVQAKQAGFCLISYVDPAGSLNIVGPKFAQLVAKQFTYPLLQRVQELADDNCAIHLCPKTTLALLGLGLAEREDLQLEPGIKFVDACLGGLSHKKLLGQACIKNSKCVLRHGRLWLLQLV